MVNILSSDILVADIIVSVPSADELAQKPAAEQAKYTEVKQRLDGLLEKNGARHGEGIPLNKQEARALFNSLQQTGIGKVEPGGSSSNIFTTLSRLMGNNISTDYIGVIGNDAYSNIIKEDLGKAGVNILPVGNDAAEPALSFVFAEPDGSYTRATYPGNADKLLKPELITDDIVRKNDVVLLPGSLWRKLGRAYPEALHEKALQQDKRIFLTFPSQAKFEHLVPEGAYQHLIRNADVIVGDEKELTDIYNTGDDFERAAQMLQEDLNKRDEIRQAQGKPNRNRSAAAFIIRSDNSATLLTAASPPGAFMPEAAHRKDFPPVNKSFGAQDAAYAGFLSGYASGLKPLEAAELALKVANTKSLYSDSPRIPESVTKDPATKEEWKGYQNSLSNSLQNIGNAFSTALTGVSNVVDQKRRTRGMKFFDLFLYPILTNTAVFALSVFVTHQTTYGNDDTFWGRALRARGDKSRQWTADKMQGWFNMEPARAENTAKMSMMVLWSFLDGSLMAPIVAWFETKRNSISRWLDKRLGTTPDDQTVYDTQIKRDWKSIFLGRAATAAIVIPTAIALNQPRAGGAKSWNTALFEDTGGRIGDSNLIKKLFPKLSQKTVMNDSGQKIPFLKAMGEISAFELFYTSVCTFGLWIGGMTFAKLFNKENRQEKAENTTSSATAANTEDPHPDSMAPSEDRSSFAQTIRDEREAQGQKKALGERTDRIKAQAPQEQSGSFVSKAEESKEQAAQTTAL